MRERKTGEEDAFLGSFPRKWSPAQYFIFLHSHKTHIYHHFHRNMVHIFQTTVEPLYLGTSRRRAPRLNGHLVDRPIDFLSERTSLTRAPRNSESGHCFLVPTIRSNLSYMGTCD